MAEIRFGGQWTACTDMVVTVTGVTRRPTKEEQQYIDVARVERQRTLASQRATALLRAHLDPAQLQEFDATGAFRVLSPDGEYGYYIRKTGGVLLYKRRGRFMRLFRRGPERWAFAQYLCIEVDLYVCPDPQYYVSWYPRHDVMLTLKLAFELEEERTLRIANLVGNQCFQSLE